MHMQRLGEMLNQGRKECCSGDGGGAVNNVPKEFLGATFPVPVTLESIAVTNHCHRFDSA
jgi:hypothetical protein